ncbi:MAG: SpoIIE family protein phosphatase [candidate division KSB1 bacterium]|nr:SpoIIE family protein phosphatase [candidate division KSB1 bacterium]
MNLYQKYEEDIYELYVIDKDGLIEVSSDTAKLISGHEKVLTERQPVANNIYLYTVEKSVENGAVSRFDLYDFVEPIAFPDQVEPWGELHVRLLKSRVDEEIFRRRWEYGRLALSILLISYVGTLLLIYLLLNPFKKLADWVRALDHGEVQDEMDIDSSTEIGEIAKAFSEITTKFRESQKHLAEQEQLQKEMQVAQEIQQTLLPTDFPEIEGYEIASYYEAAKEVGGDYFDFVEVDKDTIGIVVADVSGKGVPGSLVMTMIRTALRTEARGVKDAAEVLARVNDFVVSDMKKGMFVTIFYVIIDSKRRRLNYASAGHNPMILYRPSTGKTYYLNPKGFPIGIQLSEKDLFRKSIESDTIQLAEDDILLLYTDGITEAMNARRDLFGEERLLKVIREYGHLRVKPFIEKMKMELTSFTEGQPQYDDITLVAIKEKTTPEKEELRRAKLAHQYIAEGMSIREACEKAGITTYAYYNKYKKQFEQVGVENYEVDETIAVEAKHISIEDKVKIFDIIKNHPEYGAKRISEELNTEKYGFTVIPESKIYDELVRSRLNTRQLREAWVARGGRNKRRLKPPGTPLLTLDGRIIMDQKILEDRPAEERTKPTEEAPDTAAPESLAGTTEPAAGAKVEMDSDKEVDADINIDVIARPLEDVLDKTKSDVGAEAETPAATREPVSEAVPESETADKSENDSLVPDAAEEDETILFEKLFEGGALFDEELKKTEPSVDSSEEPPATAKQDEPTAELYSSPAANVRQSLAVSDEPESQTGPPATDEVSSDSTEQDLTLSAIEDLLQKEIFSSFEEIASSIVVEEGDKGEESPADVPDEPALEVKPTSEAQTQPEPESGPAIEEEIEKSERSRAESEPMASQPEPTAEAEAVAPQDEPTKKVEITDSADDSAMIVAGEFTTEDGAESELVPEVSASSEAEISESMADTPETAAALSPESEPDIGEGKPPVHEDASSSLAPADEIELIQPLEEAIRKEAPEEGGVH